MCHTMITRLTVGNEQYLMISDAMPVRAFDIWMHVSRLATRFTAGKERALM